MGPPTGRTRVAHHPTAERLSERRRSRWSRSNFAGCRATGPALCLIRRASCIPRRCGRHHRGRGRESRRGDDHIVDHRPRRLTFIRSECTLGALVQLLNVANRHQKTLTIRVSVSDRARILHDHSGSPNSSDSAKPGPASPAATLPKRRRVQLPAGAAWLVWVPALGYAAESVG